MRDKSQDMEKTSTNQRNLRPLSLFQVVEGFHSTLFGLEITACFNSRSSRGLKFTAVRGSEKATRSRKSILRGYCYSSERGRNISIEDCIQSPRHRKRIVIESNASGSADLAPRHCIQESFTFMRIQEMWSILGWINLLYVLCLSFLEWINLLYVLCLSFLS